VREELHELTLKGTDLKHQKATLLFPRDKTQIFKIWSSPEKRLFPRVSVTSKDLILFRWVEQAPKNPFLESDPEVELDNVFGPGEHALVLWVGGGIGRILDWFSRFIVSCWSGSLTEWVLGK
jgi:hypothetical protein